jgi:outer membrane protein
MQLRSLLLPLVFGSAVAFATAQTTSVPTRIAVIDVQKVLSESAAGKAAYDKLKKVQDDRMARAKQMDEEIRKLDAEINTKRATLPESQLAELQRQLADKRVTMQRFASDADREIGQMRDRELQALELKIKPVIDALGAEMNLAAIFNKFESGLVFASDRIDITDEVIKRFNATK